MKLKIIALIGLTLVLTECKKDNENKDSEKGFFINTPNSTNYFVDLNPDSVLITDDHKVNFDTLAEDSSYKRIVSIPLRFTKNQPLFNSQPDLIFSISCEFIKHDKINRTKVEFYVTTDYHASLFTKDSYGTELVPYALSIGTLISENNNWATYCKLATFDKIEIPAYSQSMILENNNDFQKEGDNKKYIAFRYKNRQWTEYQYGWISLEIDNFNKLIIDSYLFKESSVKNKLINYGND